MKREEGVTYIATISGGKDSVTQLDLLCKNGYPLDYAVFYDTLMELPVMYEYIKKVKTYFKDRYDRDIIVTTPKTTFEEWCFGVIKDKNAAEFGAMRGIPMVWVNPCYWRREAKEKASASFIKEHNIEKAVIYIGFTRGENRSVKNTDNITYTYPLKDDFKMSERECQEYLINQEMENPLYRDFTRTGCGMCPAQSEKSWSKVWENHRDTWDYMVWVEKRLDFYSKMGMKVQNKFWFTDHRTCEDMEKAFKFADNQKSMFDFSDEPLKDCFCKI